MLPPRTRKTPSSTSTAVSFAEWHLGRDDEKSDGTKGSVSFPFGDFSKVHRCAVISLESRAAQYGHDDIRDAAKKLLELMDAD